MRRKNSDLTIKRGKQHEIQEQQKACTSNNEDIQDSFYSNQSQSTHFTKCLHGMTTFNSKKIQTIEKQTKVKKQICDAEKEFNEQREEEEEEENEGEDCSGNQLDQNQNEKEQSILPKQFVVLELLGNGGQGSVATFLDKKNNSLIALKEFKSLVEYNKESSTYNFLRRRIELHQYVNLMIDQEKSKKQIKLQIGSCSLFELYFAMRGRQRWSEINLIKIFIQMASGVLAFRKLGFFHGDIKPQNIMLFPQEDTYNAYQVKFIDFGGSGFDNNQYFCYYSELFCSSVYFNQVGNNISELNDEEVTICEVYSLVRTIWFITCFQLEEQLDFKEIDLLEIGVEFLSQRYPLLSQCVQNVIDSNGDLNKIEQAINQAIISLRSKNNKDCWFQENKSLQSKEEEMLLKFGEEEREMILGVIQKKRERFLNGINQKELEDLFEFFHSLGQDQRAIEIFLRLETPYERFLKHLLSNENNDEEILFFQDLKQKTLINEQVKSNNIIQEQSSNKKKVIDLNSSETKNQVNDQDQKEITRIIKIIKESVMLLNEKGDIKKGIKWNRFLFELFSFGKFKNDKEVILIQIQYSILLNLGGEIQKSLDTAKEAKIKYTKQLLESIEINTDNSWEQVKIDIIYGQICAVIGKLYLEIESLSNALLNYEEALLIFEAIKKQRLQILSEDSNKLNQTNSIWVNTKQNEDWELDNFILKSLIKLSQISSLMKNNQSPLDYANKALKLCCLMYGERENKHVAMCLNVKSIILKHQKEYEKALVQQKECLRIRQQIQNGIDHRCVATSLNEISILYCKLGKYEEAIANQEHCYQMRLRLFSKENQLNKQIASSLENFGTIYQASGKMEKAEEYYLKSYQIVVQSRDLFHQEKVLKRLILICKVTHQKQKQKYYTKKRIVLKDAIKNIKNKSPKKNSILFHNFEQCLRQQSSENIKQLSPTQLLKQSLSTFNETQSNQENEGSEGSDENYMNSSFSYSINSSLKIRENKHFQGRKHKKARCSSLKQISQLKFIAPSVLDFGQRLSSIEKCHIYEKLSKKFTLNQ